MIEKNDNFGNFLISISGNQIYSYEDETSSVDFTTVCNFYEKDNKFCIEYREYDYDNSATGYSFSKIIADKNEVTLKKNGSVNAILIFQRDMRHQCSYRTEYGTIFLGIYTNKISSSLTKNGGFLKINYSIDMNLNFKCFNEFSLKIWEANKNVKTFS